MGVVTPFAPIARVAASPCHTGHLDVHQYDVVILRARLAERFLAALGGFDLMSLQEDIQQRSVDLDIIDDKDFEGRESCSRRVTWFWFGAFGGDRKCYFEPERGRFALSRSHANLAAHEVDQTL